MVVKVYPSTDRHIRQHSDEIKEYAALAEGLRLPYWVWVTEERPIGLMIVGKEPTRLLAPPGTQTAVIELIDAAQPRATLERLVKEAKRMAVRHDAKYATVVLSSEDTNAVDSFRKLGFRIFSDSYTMVSRLDGEFDDRTDLRFRPVQRKEAREWASLASQFLKGSPDPILEFELENIPKLPAAFVNQVFKSETFYIVYKGRQAIGVLEINKKRGTIGNIGVKLSQRNKGYGRQMVIFGLRQLRASKCKEARLRVHSANSHAMHLYKSLGFEVKQRRLTLIWRPGGGSVNRAQLA
jgi:ribosomal protein S18 acetylase RimI-like enzyme